MTYQNKKIGILGGSFDPIHNGHLRIAQSAYEEFSLDEVWFIPAGHSPNKDEDKMTNAKTRAEMVALAIQKIPYFRLSTYEIDKSGTSYTYLTLSELNKQYPETVFYFIMGADSLDYFDSWKHPEIICEKSIILVAVRNDIDMDEILNKIKQLQSQFSANIYPLSCGKTDISSSKIRADLGEGILHTEYLPIEVADYILKNHLYQNN